MAFELFQKIREKCRSDSLERVLSRDQQKDNIVGDQAQSPSYPVIKDISPDWSEFEGCYATDMLNCDGKTCMKRRFFTQLLEILLQYINVSENRSHKVLDFHHPHQLREIMDHCIEIDENMRDLEQILSDCKETLKYCVKTGHPRFLNQLSTGMDMIGIAGEWLTAVANTNMFTYEVAPVFTHMEDVLVRKMLSRVGWKDGDGIFSPGGAISNLYAVLAARHTKFPEIKLKGMIGVPPMVILTSTHSHFSIKRAASLLGLGMDAVVYVSCDQNGRMLVEDLSQKINDAKEKGREVLMVNVTCGTTVFGAFDPVNEVADICEKNKIWLHVDGAWGGSVLLSEKHKYLLKGVERANSMTWNPHKMMGVPLQCSAILLRQQGILKNVNEVGASYLYQKDKHYDVTFDTGDKAIQCGRHNDVFKLWLMWRAKMSIGYVVLFPRVVSQKQKVLWNILMYTMSPDSISSNQTTFNNSEGDKGFESQIDKNFRLAEYLMRKLDGRKNFKLVHNEMQGPNVCFWYIPESVAKIENEQQRRKEIEQVAPRLKAAMMEKGSMMLAYQPLNDLPNFFRVAVSNPSLKESDLDFIVSELEHLAEGM